MTDESNKVPKGKGRPSLGMMFECCHIYRRIFKVDDGSAYQGRCPRCGRVARVLIGPGGSDNRVFRAH